MQFYIAQNFNKLHFPTTHQLSTQRTKSYFFIIFKLIFCSNYKVLKHIQWTLHIVCNMHIFSGRLSIRFDDDDHFIVTSSVQQTQTHRQFLTTEKSLPQYNLNCSFSYAIYTLMFFNIFLLRCKNIFKLYAQAKLKLNSHLYTCPFLY